MDHKDLITSLRNLPGDKLKGKELTPNEVEQVVDEHAKKPITHLWNISTALAGAEIAEKWRKSIKNEELRRLIDPTKMRLFWANLSGYKRVSTLQNAYANARVLSFETKKVKAEYKDINVKNIFEEYELKITDKEQEFFELLMSSIVRFDRENSPFTKSENAEKDTNLKHIYNMLKTNQGFSQKFKNLYKHLDLPKTSVLIYIHDALEIITGDFSHADPLAKIPGIYKGVKKKEKDVGHLITQNSNINFLKDKKSEKKVKDLLRDYEIREEIEDDIDLFWVKFLDIIEASGKIFPLYLNKENYDNNPPKFVIKHAINSFLKFKEAFEKVQNVLKSKQSKNKDFKQAEEELKVIFALTLKENYFKYGYKEELKQRLKDEGSFYQKLFKE